MQNKISESSGSNKKRKVKVLFPVQEEDHSVISIDKEVYKNIFKHCHTNLKEMRIGVKKQGFIALNKLKEVIADIIAIKTGNYILSD